MSFLLALDLGTNFGYCIIRLMDNEIADSGVVNLAPKALTEKQKREGAKVDESRRYINFYNTLSDMLSRYDISECAYEYVRKHKGILAAHVYGGLRAIMLFTLGKKGIYCTPLGVGSIKKHCTGRGDASKSEVIAKINEKTKLGVVDDNHADAIAIAHYYLNIKEVHNGI